MLEYATRDQVVLEPRVFLVVGDVNGRIEQRVRRVEVEEGEAPRAESLERVDDQLALELHHDRVHQAVGIARLAPAPLRQVIVPNEVPRRLPYVDPRPHGDVNGLAIHHELDREQRVVVGVGAQRCAYAIRRLCTPPNLGPTTHVTQFGRGVREHDVLPIAVNDARIWTGLTLHVLYPRPEPRTAAFLGTWPDVVGGQAREG